MGTANPIGIAIDQQFEHRLGGIFRTADFVGVDLHVAMPSSESFHFDVDIITYRQKKYQSSAVIATQPVRSGLRLVQGRLSTRVEGTGFLWLSHKLTILYPFDLARGRFTIYYCPCFRRDGNIVSIYVYAGEILIH